MIMKTSIKSLILLLTILAVSCAAVAGVAPKSALKNVFAAEQGELFNGDAFTFTGETSDMTLYGGATVSVVSAEDATEAGVPDGFSGDVLIVQNNPGRNGLDVTFDYSKSNIKRADILSVSLKVYIKSTSSDNSSYPEIRIPVPSNKNAWLLGGGKGANKTDEWLNITLTDEQIDKLCINGELKSFVLCLRTASSTTMYIDELNVEVLPPDTEAPVITAPIKEFKTTAGTYPFENGVTITDNSGKFTVEYVWSEGALDRNGRLTVGTHTLTIIATDASKNKSECVIKYIVEEEPAAKKCKIIFRAEGAEDYCVEYYADEADYIMGEIHPPKAPNKPHYIGVWQKWTLEKADEQIVYAEYMPIAYTLTLMVDGKVYKTILYTAENLNVTLPAVPEKAGYTGKWSEYTLDFSDNVIVEAIYTEKTEHDPAQGNGGCGSALGGGGVLSIFAAIGIAVVVKRKSK